MKNIIITTGGTIEKIDGVRGISNFSSGRLGIMLAEKFAETSQVFLIRGKKTTRAKASPNIIDMEITDARSVVECLQDISESYTIDVVIHAMAVADYTVRNVTSIEEILSDLGSLPNAITIGDISAELTGRTVTQSKLSSTIKNPVIVLEQTPKIIQKIKTWWPNTTLVGFKLLNGVTEEELCRVAMESMVKSNANFVLANDLTNISGEYHKAILLDRYGYKVYTQTKSEIVSLLYETLG